MRMLHLGLRVCDLDASLKFYTAIGYKVLGAVPETEFGSLTMLKLPDDEFVSLELVHDPSSDFDTSAVNHLVIHVEDMHAAIAQFAANGVEADPPASPDESDDFLTSWITDPDGYHIELVQWPASHPAAGLTEEDMAADA